MLGVGGGDIAATPPEMQMEVIDKGAIIAEVNQFFEQKSQDRRPYEYDWFLNAAAVRLGSDNRVHPITAQLEPLTKEPRHRNRQRINRIRVKYKAKLAKYTNTRPRPIVVPASDDREDHMDAQLSEQFLLYIWRKLDLEAKYEQVTAWAEITGKAFWAFRWNPDARVRVRNPQTGEVVEVAGGDVEVDVTTAFEILPDDAGIEFLAGQERMMRVKLRQLKEVEQRFGVPSGKILGDASSTDAFQFQKQIAGLGAKYNTGSTFSVSSGQPDAKAAKDMVLVKELFTKPCPQYPNGRYVVVAGGQLLKYQEELPYGFSTFSNPYPFEEFAAEHSPGQFWPTTMVEQLRPVGEQYNVFRQKIVEHLQMNSHGKLLIPRMAKVAENAWHSDSGEKVYYNHIPGMPAPHPVFAPQLSADTWKLLEWADREFDVVSNISASSLGLGTDAESGYQSVVLQEANDTVFGPDRNRMQRALAASLSKIRRIAAQGYTEDRIIAAVGRGYKATVFVFNQSNIDEAAEIVVQIGSALPDGKAARLQSIMEIRASGLLGDADAPRVRRGLLDLADLGGIEADVDPEHQDANRARLENVKVQHGQPLDAPLPWQKHAVHAVYHEEQLNAPEFDSWAPEQKLELIHHYLLHLRVVDPVKGLEVAMMFAEDQRIMQLVPMFQQIVTVMQSQMAPTGAPGQSPQPGGGPAPAESAPAQAPAPQGASPVAA
jgi:hypothetical protein